MPRVRIAWSGGEVIAHFETTPTGEQVLAKLPCSATARTWGEEVYFEFPVGRTALEPDARQVVEPGTVCYWVEGGALALPFGPTPLSQDGECRLVTRCNVLGRVEGDSRRLATVKAGAQIRVERLPDARNARPPARFASLLSKEERHGAAA